ncbi:MAG: hypothetical protein ACFCUT_06870 [Kiloniellaceae bacterium]
MVFSTEPHVDRAKKLVESGDAAELHYACLELRFALERFTYQKLQQRLDKITIEEIGAWQPRRAMERLIELVDEHLTGDSVFRVAVEKVPGREADEEDFVTVGSTKGVNPKDIGKHWQKLGSFLHATMPKHKGERPRPPDEHKLRSYLQEVIQYTEDITSTGFDAFFSQNVTFQCDKCGQSIVRNHTLLKEGDVVQCQNPACEESFVVHREGEEFRFKGHVFNFDCPSCERRNYIAANKLLKLDHDKRHRISCVSCGQSFSGHWVMALEPVDKPPEASSEPVQDSAAPATT